MLTLRTATALALPASRADLRFAPAPSVVLESTLDWSLDAVCTTSEIVAAGEDLPDEDRPPALFLERLHLKVGSELALTDVKHRGKDANLGLERTLGAWTLDGDAASFGPFEDGLTVRYLRENERDPYELEELDADGEPAQSPAVLRALSASLEPRSWLLELDSTEADATLEQQLDGRALLAWLTPVLELDGLVDLGESFPAGSFPELLVLELEEALQSGSAGRATWIVKGRSNDEGAEVLELAVRVELDFEGDLTRSFFSLFEALVPGANPQDSELQADLTLGGELEGTLKWNLDGNHLHSAQWGGEVELDVTVEGDVSVEGFAVPIEALFAWEAQLSCTSRVSGD
jgi:hypothetical protein